MLITILYRSDRPEHTCEGLCCGRCRPVSRLASVAAPGLASRGEFAAIRRRWTASHPQTRHS
ncbi:protein of unknown function [Modestobacter italicus]|uniref:Uncharacterized protein n=1 Tax=Modestobacter italicus (strain DSM 44449 / CECT 9708 / BC 501) TaxID=2732864 RepID=I4F2S6_MODI5|nr:protein of unknown function [Modestobacter marinus]